jgi:hypothetical protein
MQVDFEQSLIFTSFLLVEILFEFDDSGVVFIVQFAVILDSFSDL